MRRDEFKLLMEDWKRNFVIEDEVVSNTLNEGYTELDRMILEEGLKDNPVIQKVVKLGIPLSLAATLFSSGLLNTQGTNADQDHSPRITHSQTFAPQSSEVGKEYQDLDIGNENMKSPIDNIESDFKEDFKEMQSKEIKITPSSPSSREQTKKWLEKNLDNHAKKIAAQAEKNADSAGKSIPGIEDGLGDVANAELLNQARKSLLDIANKDSGFNFNINQMNFLKKGK